MDWQSNTEVKGQLFCVEYHLFCIQSDTTVVRFLKLISYTYKMYYDDNHLTIGGFTCWKNTE